MELLVATSWPDAVQGSVEALAWAIAAVAYFKFLRSQ